MFKQTILVLTLEMQSQAKQAYPAVAICSVACKGTDKFVFVYITQAHVERRYSGTQS